MKLLIPFLISTLFSISLFSQGSLDVSAGWMLNGINNSDFDGSPFVSLGFSTKISDPFDVSVAVSGNKLGIEGLSGFFLQPEVKLVLRNRTPVTLHLGGFVSTLINQENDKREPVRLRGFNAGLLFGLGLRYKKMEIYGTYLLGLTDVFVLEDNFQRFLNDLEIEGAKGKTRSIKIGIMRHF